MPQINIGTQVLARPEYSEKRATRWTPKPPRVLGTVAWVHPQDRYCLVVFEDCWPLRQCFFPEELEVRP